MPLNKNVLLKIRFYLIFEWIEVRYRGGQQGHLVNLILGSETKGGGIMVGNQNEGMSFRELWRRAHELAVKTMRIF